VEALAYGDYAFDPVTVDDRPDGDGRIDLGCLLSRVGHPPES
jgi:hypothetical protein